MGKRKKDSPDLGSSNRPQEQNEQWGTASGSGGGRAKRGPLCKLGGGGKAKRFLAGHPPLRTSCREKKRGARCEKTNREKMRVGVDRHTVRPWRGGKFDLKRHGHTSPKMSSGWEKGRR